MASKVLKDKVVKDKGSKSNKTIKEDIVKNKIVSELNDNQKNFCIEYIKDLNELQAYRRAYGEDIGDNTCKSNASTLFTKSNIRAYINELVDSYTENLDVTVGEIVNNLKSMAFDEKARHSDRIKASQLLDQYKQMLIEKKEITVTSTDIVVTLED